LDIYYEEYGSGEPLVLLHGGTATSKMWGQQIPAFAERFRVIAPDTRGHGNTDNPTGEFSYRLLADDAAGFIQTLELRQPIVCGYSDGGQIALELGMRYPELAGALVVGAAWFRFTDAYRAWLAAWGFEGPGRVDLEHVEREMSWLVEIWQEWHAPRGADYWKTLLPRISTMWMTPLDYTEADFQKIGAPTLILMGDRDELIPLEEAVDMYRLIQGAELAIVPGSDHMFFRSRPEIFTNAVLDFFLRQSATTETVETHES
jgi:pimeloyl-ACP methyl ester carboxylesterase